MRDLLIGVDGGTGGIRAFVFDAAGTVLGSAGAPYETAYPKSGWAEQKAEDWWQSTCDGVRAAMAEAGVGPERIAAICGATTSCTVLACTKDGEALAPAILWMDVRAAKQREKILHLTGQSLNAEHFPCKILWMKEEAPEIYEKADLLCEYQDYWNYKLTGKWCFSVNTTCNWGYDKRKGDFDRAFYRTVGLEDALEKLPPVAVCAGEVVGKLTEKAAAELGLDTGVTVVQGGIDASIGMLGMGVAEPGAIALMTGSSNLAMAVTRTHFFGAPDAINLGPDFLLDGYYTSVQGQVSTGSILRWFKREFCRDMGDSALAALDKLAADVPCGAEGLLVLDYWQGNRVPHEDADVRGMIYGLSMNTTREMIFRAVMEGVACGTEDLLQAFRDKGNSVDRVCISGGTTRSDLFLQIHADVSGVPFEVTSDYSVALGSAICAGKGVGLFSSLKEGAEKMVHFRKTVYPNMDNHRIYKDVLKKYRAMYPALCAWREANEQQG